MKVTVTFDIGTYEREAIAHHYGNRGRAPYLDVRAWIVAAVRGELETAVYDYDRRNDEPTGAVFG